MVLNALLDIFRGGKTPRDGTAPSKKRPRKSEKCAETSKLSKLSRLSSFTECPDASVNLAFTTLVGRTLCDDDARKIAIVYVCRLFFHFGVPTSDFKSNPPLQIGTPDARRPRPRRKMATMTASSVPWVEK